MQKRPLINAKLAARYMPAVLSLCLLLGGEPAMAKEELILCSPVKGRLLDGGKPVEGAEIKRIVSWTKYEQSRVDFATTDAEGYYKFDEVKELYSFSWLDGIFHQPSVMSSLFLDAPDRIISLLVTGKYDYKLGTETGLPVIQLTSDMKTLVESETKGYYRIDSDLVSADAKGDHQ